MIKVIATDFDWTLLDHSGGPFTLCKDLMVYFNQFLSDGGHVGIVSGRVFEEMRDTIEKIGVPFGRPYPDFVVCLNAYAAVTKGGALHYDADKMETEARIMLRTELLSGHLFKMLSVIKQENILLKNWTANGKMGFAFFFETLEDAERACLALKRWIEQSGLSPIAHAERNALIVEVSDLERSKGKALYDFVKKRGIRPDEVLAVGDSFNDESMLDGGYGFVAGCVGNAEEGIKQLVHQQGGYVGEGMASQGVWSVVQMAIRDGKLPSYPR